MQTYTLDILDNIESLEDIFKLKQKIQQIIQTKGQNLIKDEFKTFFDLHPEVEIISFTAYTPYFMDGDPCIYGVNDYYYYIPTLLPELIENYGEEDAKDQIYEWIEHWSLYSWPLGGGVKQLKPEIAEIYPTLPEDMDNLENRTRDPNIAYEIYGDHCRVIITPTSLSVDACDHD